MPKLFVPKETAEGERRVAATPETVKRFIKEGLEVEVEQGAGNGAHIDDELYTAAGASIVADGSGSWQSADIVFMVVAPTVEKVALLKAGSIVAGFLAPHRNTDMIRALVKGQVTSMSVELVPRITRAQTMDALSSQASIAGYKAVLIAAARLGKYLPLLMTAAGTVPPARVVIMGAGVAGLQAVATAKRLGAIVEVSDIRPVVKEQVESLGGRFIELPMEESGEGAGGYAKEMGEDFLRRQREIVTRHVAAADIVICTAQIPGRRAPVLVTADMVRQMRTGAVIVDLAVDSGGNCELSEPEQEIVSDGVYILGYSNLPATVPEDASMLYARNLQALMLPLLKDGAIALDLNDEVFSAVVVTHQGEVKHAPTAELMKGA